MKIKALVLMLILVVIANLSQAQSLEVCYQQIPGPNDTDTLNIFFSSNADTNIMVRAVVFSFAFQLGCSDIRILENEFLSMWGNFLEKSARDSNLNLMYNGITYDTRFSYGNADPNMGNQIPLVVPFNQYPGVFAMSLLVSGSCRDLVYMENEAENQVNQMGNQDFIKLGYLLNTCGPAMSLSDEFEEGDITVYPNPATTSLVIDWEKDFGKKGEIRVIDAFGRLKYSETHSFSSGVILDIGGLAAGSYFLGMYDEDGKLAGRKRFVKL